MFFFARDLLNYAGLMPVHLAQMNALEQEDPTTWVTEIGDFVVALHCSLTRHWNKIKDLKRHSGIVGLSEDDSGLDRLVTISPQLTRMVKQYLSGFPKFSQTS